MLTLWIDMKQTLFFTVVLVCLALSPLPVLAADAPVLSQSRDLALTAEDYRALFASELSAQQRAALRGEAAELELMDFVYSVHANLGLWQAAEAAGLAQREDLAHSLRRNRQRLLIEAYLKDVAEQWELPDFAALAEQRYAVDPDAFKIPERRQAAHILLADRPRAGCDCSARPSPEQILQRLAAGEDFAALAKQYSDDPASAAQGGLLPKWAEAGKPVFVDAFQAALFRLPEVGALSAPVETRFGIHIIQLADRQPARVPPFAEVRGKIIAKLRAEYLAQKSKELQSVYYPDPQQVDYAALRALLAELDEQTEQTEAR